jgi:hypothetical protein
MDGPSYIDKSHFKAPNWTELNKQGAGRPQSLENDIAKQYGYDYGAYRQARQSQWNQANDRGRLGIRTDPNARFAFNPYDNHGGYGQAHEVARSSHMEKLMQLARPTPTDPQRSEALPAPTGGQGLMSLLGSGGIPSSVLLQLFGLLGGGLGGGSGMPR